VYVHKKITTLLEIPSAIRPRPIISEKKKASQLMQYRNEEIGILKPDGLLALVGNLFAVRKVKLGKNSPGEGRKESGGKA
jgi:hypothetical protein